ncbi:MAG: hypothetical protein U0324_21700 [Polyangiales bacterium]
MRRPLAWLLLAPWLAACGDDAPTPAPDAAADVSPDAARDAAPDVAPDVASDLAADVAPDIAADAAPDVTADAAPDASSDVTDAGADVTDAADDVRLVNGCPVLEAPVARMGDDPMGDTYAGFARDFFQRLCVRCHATALRTSTERMGAPDGMNWDDEAAVRRELARIRRAVGVDNYMPLNPPLATCAERRRLVRWVDLGAP